MAATIFEKNGTVLTVKPEGRLDAATSPILQKDLLQHLDGVREIVMDFTKVEYISSAGLRMLMVFEQKMEDTGGSLHLIHVNENIIEILELVGYTDLLTVERE